VVIPAINEAEHIGRSVQYAWRADPAEVIVADGGSSDRTCEIAADAGAVVIRTDRGRAVQQNCGARAATGNVLLFLHADNRLAPDGVEQVISALADASVLGGAFRQRIEAPGLAYRLLERGNALRVRCWGLPYGDQGIFMRREIFEQLGGFPEVRLMEDLLLMRLLRPRAWPVLLPGPLHVSPRRWQRHGVIRQTLRNWRLLAAEAFGVSPDRLADSYPPHDCDSQNGGPRIQ